MFMKNLIKLNSPQSTPQHNRQKHLFDLKAELAQLPRAQEPATFRTCSLILAKYFSRVADDDSAIDILHSLEADEEVACELGFAHVRKGEWHAAINAFQSVQPPTYLTTYHTVLTSMKGSLDPCEYVEPLVKPTATRKILPTMNLECPNIESLLALHTRCEAKMREASVPGSILFPSLLLGRREVNWFDENVLLRLASINQLPVDGRQHLAVREKLDDKVGLHNLMGGSNFVPRGFVIGGEGSSSGTLCDTDERRDWVVKDPKGWGGFGLTFFENMNIDEVVSSGRQDNGRPRSSSRTPLVAQEIVRSALVDGRCFSIRLFVILRDGGVFYTRNCLMKLSREGEKISNSAWNAIEGEEGQKEGWSILRGRVDELEGLLRDVFGRLKDEGDLEALTQCIVPKVLGFDLMLSEEGELKLIECNGTPGLIARSTDGVEFQVKKTVLEEAWGREDGGLVKLGVA
ncbi:hypothetical protein TrCOL_g2474 [Triparma columacea]|uniref:Uncharacterized protein n=1 Tax=Triparma columacea TaxID=722753 RepID=A0A9W7FY15_9STRA|nr:hypothetical protein TrCOL_g2474 [Triparma columacea]